MKNVSVEAFVLSVAVSVVAMLVAKKIEEKL